MAMCTHTVPFSSRSLSENTRLSEIVGAVVELEQAIIKDTGITSEESSLPSISLSLSPPSLPPSFLPSLSFLPFPSLPPSSPPSLSHSHTSPSHPSHL